MFMLVIINLNERGDNLDHDNVEEDEAEEGEEDTINGFLIKESLTTASLGEDVNNEHHGSVLNKIINKILATGFFHV